MNLIVIAPTYYGHDGAIARAFESLGHRVVVLGYFPHTTLVDKVRNRIVDEALPYMGSDTLRRRKLRRFNDQVVAIARATRPDAVVVVKGEVLEPETVEVLGGLARLLYWGYDDPRRFPTVMAALPLYDVVSSFAKESAATLSEAGIPTIHLPDGFDATVFGRPHCRVPDEWRREVSFVGARYPEREATLETLVGRFRVGIWGGDWKRRPWRARYYEQRTALDGAVLGSAGLEQSAAIYRDCPINLNIHAGGAGVGLNMRVFEIPGAGGFQISDENPELGESFEIGREVVTYSCAADLREKIDFYLRHDHERERIRAAGAERARREHTLAHRMRRLLQAMGTT